MKLLDKIMLEILVKKLRDNGYSYRGIQRVIKEGGIKPPSLGFICRVLNKK